MGREPCRHNPAAARRAFDQRYGTNAHKKFLALCQTGTYAAAAHAFGHNDRQWACSWYGVLSAGEPKPPMRFDPRPDVTRSNIRQAIRTSRSLKEAAANLGVNQATLKRRAARHGLTPPNGNAELRDEMEAVRSFICLLGALGSTKRSIASAIGRKLAFVREQNQRYRLGLRPEPRGPKPATT